MPVHGDAHVVHFVAGHVEDVEDDGRLRVLELVHPLDAIRADERWTFGFAARAKLLARFGQLATSSPNSAEAGGWEIAFNSGGVTLIGGTSDRYFVRCVRDGTPPPATHYSAGTGSLSGTVLDNATQLRWQAAEIGPSST